MKKVWDVIKKIGVWIFTVLAAIFAVLFIKEKDCRGKPDNDMGREDSDEINKKAAAKRKEAISRIESADARSIAEEYDAVCDAIADGKKRFRRRVADCGRRD